MLYVEVLLDCAKLQCETVDGKRMRDVVMGSVIAHLTKTK